MSKAFSILAAGIASALVASAALAETPLTDSGRLLLTGGVTTIEGSGGGGLATWATITGYGSNDGVGANVHDTYVGVKDYSLRDYGFSTGLFNRVELSYTREDFDTGVTGAKLGLGKGFTFSQDIVGAKVRLIGDVVYDQDSLLPQIAVGAQFKRNDQDAIVHYLGATKSSGVDYYVAATKLFLDQSLLLNATVRWTKANQTGLLGFGGDKNDTYNAEFEGSAAYLFTKKLAAGVEYRSKPDNLGFAKEGDWADVFVAYALNKNLSATLAYVDLGSIATFKDEHGLYLSLQAGF